jgi:hypothetical protein
MDNEINQQQQQQRTKANDDDDEMNNKSKEGKGKGRQKKKDVLRITFTFTHRSSYRSIDHGVMIMHTAYRVSNCRSQTANIPIPIHVE